jgi:hypothetical protein
MLQCFGSLAQHWSTILIAIGVVFFSVMQFREVFWSAGLLEMALIAVGMQAVFAGSRVILHGWFCEKAIKVELTSEDKDMNQLRRIHGAMLRELRKEHGWVLRGRLSPFHQQALLPFFCWTLVPVIFGFAFFTCRLHWAQFWNFIQGVLQGSWRM